MSKEKVVSIEQFRKPTAARKTVPGMAAAAGSEGFEELTKAGKAFRERFLSTLAKMEAEFNNQLAKAERASDVNIRINISAILKRAQSSPLSAYSDLHKEFVAEKVEQAKKRCEMAIREKFKVVKERPTIQSLQRQLALERAEHDAATSRLASQKMTEYLKASGRK